jgi:hypothetical protein
VIKTENSENFIEDL